MKSTGVLAEIACIRPHCSEDSRILAPPQRFHSLCSREMPGSAMEQRTATHMMTIISSARLNPSDAERFSPNLPFVTLI